MSFKPSLNKKAKPVGADGHRKRMIGKFLNSFDKDVYKRDLLEILLFYSIPVRDTRDIAVSLMQDNSDSIFNVLEASKSKLCNTKGIGPKSAALIKAVGIAAKRTAIKKAKVSAGAEITFFNFDDIIGILKNDPHEERLYVTYNLTKYRYGEVRSAPADDIAAVSKCIEEILMYASINHAVGITAFRSAKNMKEGQPSDILNMFKLESVLAVNHIPLYAYYLTDGDKIYDLKNIYE